MKRTAGALQQKAFSLELLLGHRRWGRGSDLGDDRLRCGRRV